MFLWPTVLTIAGIITDSFAPLGHVDACYLGGEYPPGCDMDPFVECIRGYDVEEKRHMNILAILPWQVMFWLQSFHLFLRIWYTYHIPKSFGKLEDIAFLASSYHRTIRARYY